MTLCLIHKHPNILLGMKKRGFGQGRWNGFGGKVNEGESIEDAAKRELLEESGIVADKLCQLGVINFSWQGKEDILQVNIFKTIDFSGKEKESDEMNPKWFNIKDIPYDKMWPDDKYWMGLFLENKKFKGEFLFGRNDEILKYKLEQL